MTDSGSRHSTTRSRTSTSSGPTPHRHTNEASGPVGASLVTRPERHPATYSGKWAGPVTNANSSARGTASATLWVTARLADGLMSMAPRGNVGTDGLRGGLSRLMLAFGRAALLVAV